MAVVKGAQEERLGEFMREVTMGVAGLEKGIFCGSKADDEEWDEEEGEEYEDEWGEGDEEWEEEDEDYDEEWDEEEGEEEDEEGW